MFIRLVVLTGLAGWLAAGGAHAEVPRVAADIAPIHSLVARVMEGVGEPALIVRPGPSPHGYALRPSEARALQDADLVFWVGPELEPWLEGAIATLATGEAQALLDAPGTRRLSFRRGAVFADPGGQAGGQEAVAGAGDHPHDHAPEAVDPHAWLDPENGKAWLDEIATTLGQHDPAHADLYAANARAGKIEIDAAAAQARDRLAEHGAPRFVVFHDAYHYFESRFGIASLGAIELGDASDPSPARIRDVRQAVQDLDVECVLAEPQFNLGLVRTVTEGTSASIAIIDPMGTDIAPGPGFYPDLIRSVAADLASCAQ